MDNYWQRLEEAVADFAAVLRSSEERRNISKLEAVTRKLSHVLLHECTADAIPETLRHLQADGLLFCELPCVLTREVLDGSGDGRAAAVSDAGCLLLLAQVEALALLTRACSLRNAAEEVVAVVQQLWDSRLFQGICVLLDASPAATCAAAPPSSAALSAHCRDVVELSAFAAGCWLAVTCDPQLPSAPQLLSQLSQPQQLPRLMSRVLAVVTWAVDSCHSRSTAATLSEGWRRAAAAVVWAASVWWTARKNSAGAAFCWNSIAADLALPTMVLAMVRRGGLVLETTLWRGVCVMSRWADDNIAANDEAGDEPCLRSSPHGTPLTPRLPLFSAADVQAMTSLAHAARDMGDVIQGRHTALVLMMVRLHPVGAAWTAAVGMARDVLERASGATAATAATEASDAAVHLMMEASYVDLDLLLSKDDGQLLLRHCEAVLRPPRAHRMADLLHAQQGLQLLSSPLLDREPDACLSLIVTMRRSFGVAVTPRQSGSAAAQVRQLGQKEEVREACVTLLRQLDHTRELHCLVGRSVCLQLLPCSATELLTWCTAPGEEEVLLSIHRLGCSDVTHAAGLPRAMAREIERLAAAGLHAEVMRVAALVVEAGQLLRNESAPSSPAETRKLAGGFLAGGWLHDELTEAVRRSVQGEDMPFELAEDVHAVLAETAATPPSWDSCMLATSDTSSGVVPFFGCWHRRCGTTEPVGSERLVRTRKCGGCGRARYCSDACQRAAWQDGHRAACRAMSTASRPAVVIGS